tara:strand:- start:54091 stop:54504 length:414 start_codon:yes stop_codon:yes gene_type:complete
MISQKRKVAVYGSLLSGLHNNQLLGSSELLGSFESEPKFKMVAIGNDYPGVIKKGNTSIKMEVYNVDNLTLKGLDMLEGYKKSNKKDDNYYIRETIDTPYGKVFAYFYNKSIKELTVVKSGDWKEHLGHLKLTKYAK